MIRHSINIVAVLLFFPLLAFAVNAEKINLDMILSKLSFSPEFPKEEYLVEGYGDGCVSYGKGVKYRNYFQSQSGNWLRVRVNDDDKVYGPVTEILLSMVPLATKKSSPKWGVDTDNIKGVKFGYTTEQVKQMLGSPFREYSGRLGNDKNLKIMEYFPSSLETGSCIRYYMKDDQVVAFSYSSEE